MSTEPGAAEPAAPAQTFGGRPVSKLTDDDLQRYRRTRLANAVSFAVCLICIATGPVLIATAFARDEILEDFGNAVFGALGSLVLATVVAFVIELIVLRRYRSVAAYRRHLADSATFEISTFGMFVLKEIEIVVLRGILPSVTAASLFVTVLRLTSKDAAFEQQQLYQYYVFAYFALFGMIAIALSVRRVYLDQETRNKIAA